MMEAKITLLIFELIAADLIYFDDDGKLKEGVK